VERYLLHISLEDNEPSVVGGANPSTESRTYVKCSAHSSVHPGIKFTKHAYSIKF